MRLGVVLLLAGCDRLFGINGVAVMDGLPVDAAPPAMITQQVMASLPDAFTLDVSLPATPTRGHVLVMIGGSEHGVSNVTGGGVTPWQIAAQSAVSPTSYIWIGVTDGSNATAKLQTLTSGKMWVVLTEWTGLAITSTVDAGDGNGSGSGGSGTATVGVGTTSAPDLLLFAMSSFGPVADPAGAWAHLPSTSVGSVAQRAWFRFVDVGTQTVDITFANDYDATLAALRTTPQRD